MCSVVVIGAPAFAHADWLKASFERPRVMSSPKGAHPTYGYGQAGAARSARGVLDLRGALTEVTPVVPRSAWRARTVELETLEPSRIADAGLTSLASSAEPHWIERQTVGTPYKINGKTYVPAPSPGYSEAGLASWYGEELRGRRTANGEIFDPTAITAAHPTLPLPSLVQVTNLENGREIIVRVNDRGPFARGRLIDVSRGAAEVLGFRSAGEARVHVRYLGPAPKRVDAAAAEASPAAAPAESNEVSGPEASAPPETGYFVQLGAFAEQANADRASQTAAVLGRTDVTFDGRLHRVRLVGMADREMAEAARLRAAELGFASALVARTP